MNRVLNKISQIANLWQVEAWEIKVTVYRSIPFLDAIIGCF